MPYEKNGFTLRYLSDELEKRYQDDMLNNLILRARASGLLALFFFSSYAFLDPWIAGNALASVWSIRLAASLTILAYLVFVCTQPCKNYDCHLVTAITISLVGIAVIAMIATVGVGGGIFYHSGFLIVIAYANLTGLRFVYSIGVSLLLLICYALMIFFVGETAGIAEMSNSFNLVSMCAIGLYTSYSIESSSRKMFMQNQLIDQSRKEASRANQAKS
ncbi:MAG: hypothetical protein KAG19_03620, partial [Methylococcales bacterium]|nr:hypothetical protein [Methylococcales bacterium]